MSDFLPEKNSNNVLTFSSDASLSHGGEHIILSDSAELDSFLLHRLLPVSKSLGFCSIHIIPADYAPAGRGDFLKKFSSGFPEGLEYLSKNQDVRDHPEMILEKAKSVISVALSYHSRNIDDSPDTACISAYAVGRDYHKVIKQRLDRLSHTLKEFFPDIHCRAITDSAPFYEQHFAASSLLTYRGLNGLVRTSDAGCMVFLGELLVDIELTPPDTITCFIPINARHETISGQENLSGETEYRIVRIPAVQHADREKEKIPDIPEKLVKPCPPACRNCLRHCPTSALSADGFNPSKCISYLTIEYGGIIPQEYWKAIGNHLYGCDNCQIYCPFNKHVQVKGDQEFTSRFNQDFLQVGSLLNLTSGDFKKYFAGTAVYRIGYYRLMRNLTVVAANSGNSEHIPKLKKLLDLCEYWQNRINNTSAVSKECTGSQPAEKDRPIDSAGCLPAPTEKELAVLFFHVKKALAILNQHE